MNVGSVSKSLTVKFHEYEVTFGRSVHYQTYSCKCILLFHTCFWGAEGAPILFSVLGFSMASCS